MPSPTTKTIDATFPETLARTREALISEGFQIVFSVDLQKLIKQHLDLPISSYMILGVTHMPTTNAALQSEPCIGLFMPWHVAVRELDGTVQTEVAVTSPELAAQQVSNPKLQAVVDQVESRFQTVVDQL